MTNVADDDLARRLRVTFELFQAGVDMMRQKIRRENPTLAEAEVDRRLLVWLHTRPGAEHGDGEGVPVEWPRN